MKDMDILRTKLTIEELGEIGIAFLYKLKNDGSIEIIKEDYDENEKIVEKKVLDTIPKKVWTKWW